MDVVNVLDDNYLLGSHYREKMAQKADKDPLGTL